jgi:glycosyltransferase involved in cell wall biosynthesis/ribosomal protein S18 acetylase RimI-like enzyme
MTPVRVAHVTTIDLTLRFLLMGQLTRLRDEGFDVTTISAPGPWVADLENEGIRHIPWPHATRSWNPRSDLIAFAELLRLFGRERFHLVHTHNPKPGVMGRMAARLAGVPCVVNTVHGLYATPDDPARKRIPVLVLERIAAACSDLELYQSREDLDWARRLRLVSPAKSLLLGNGTDLALFDPSAVSAERRADLRRELEIQDDALVVGTVGRLVAEKGYRELFEAAAHVRDRLPHVRFVAVGDVDPEKADTLTDREIRQAGEHFVFTGWRRDVRDLLAVFDVFVLASWREGLPRSAVEAAAMGKPLVLTDIRGCREVARDGIEALLVPPRSAADLAKAVMRLAEDTALRTRLGDAARARALQSFDERRVSDQVVRSYQELLARKGIAMPRSGRAHAPVIRPARSADVGVLARLHRESLPDSFLPSLGDGFLRRLYRALVTDPEAVVVVAEDGPGVVGFASGVPSVRTFFRRFYLRHGVAAALAAAPKAFRRGTLHRARETASYPAAAHALPDAELLAIGVAADRRNGGVGRQLAMQILDRLSERGASQIKVVVASNNEGANRFYTQLGFRPLTEMVLHEGHSSKVLVFTCPSSSVSPSRSS